MGVSVRAVAADFIALQLRFCAGGQSFLPSFYFVLQRYKPIQIFFAEATRQDTSSEQHSRICRLVEKIRQSASANAVLFRSCQASFSLVSN